MTFCSDNQNENEIIERVERVNDEYNIYYLNGTKAKPYNSDKEYLNKLEEKMIKQALERENQITSLNNYKIKYILLTTLSLILFYISTEKKQSIIAVLGLLFTIISNSIYLKNNKKIKELKKYKILLENYKEFKENPRVARIIEFEPLYCDPLDIMSIDKYSLNDVKKMYKKLKEIKNNQEC